MKKAKSSARARLQSWFSGIDKSKEVMYLAIADRLEEAIRTSQIKPGELLPTHRELAIALDVNVGTVTRAYAEAKRRKLVGAGRRRGSHVLGQTQAVPNVVATRPVPQEPEAPLDNLIDLTTSRPTSDLYTRELGRTLTELGGAPQALEALQGYYPSAGMPAHRAAAAEWLRRGGLDADPAQVLVCDGAQHGLAAALLAVTKAGDLVLTEGLTYPGVKVLASLLGLRLHGLPIDQEGVLPQALAAVCTAEQPRVLICVPNLHNPTNAVLSAERRQEIARIATKHDLIVIEDDVYGALLEERLPPIAVSAPERTFLVTSLSKTIAPGLRVGFLMAPARLVDRATAGIRGTTWMASPLMAEIASRWIGDGTADRLVGAHREQLKARQAMAANTLAMFETVGHPCSAQLWLRLPPPWRSEEFRLQAHARGVAVMPAEAFAVGHVNTPHAVRLNLGAARDLQQLEQALQLLVGMLMSRPEPAHLVA